MKIAVICLNLKWQAGGTRLIYSLAQGLKKLGHQVVIYTPEFNPEAFPEERKGLEIKVVPPAYPFSWNEKINGFWARVQSKLKQERLYIDTSRRIATSMDSDFDIVNVHDFAFPVAFFYKKINPKTKVIWTENDPPYTYLPKSNPFIGILSRLFNSYKDLQSRKYFKAIDKVNVLDLYNQNWASSRGLRAVVIRSGIDFKNFYQPLKDSRLRSKPFKILSLGALNIYRRFEDIIKATEMLKNKKLDVVTTIIAKDIWEETFYKNKLTQLVQDLGLNSDVKLNFEGVSNEEFQKTFRDSDVFVLSTYLPPPRNGYGWGLTNFEAMAAGLPLILCNTSTACEVLKDGENVLLVDPLSPDQIADKVELLIKNPELANRLSQNGQRYVQDNLSWEKYAHELVNLFSNSSL